MPSADIWDDEEEFERDEAWLVEAQVVVHEPDAPGATDHAKPTVGALYDGREDEALAGRMLRWSRTSAFGAGLAAMGLGIQKVLYPDDPIEIEIQNDTDDDDEPTDPVSVRLDQDHPERSVATLRPWLDRTEP